MGRWPLPRQFWPSLAAFVAVSLISLYLVSLGSPLLSVAAVSGLTVLALMLIAHSLRRFADSERRYRHLLNTANDGIIAIDPMDGRIIGCNAKFSTLAGRDEAELIGRLYRDLFSQRERDQLADADGRMRDGLMQLHLLHRDGRLTPVEVSGSYTLWDESEALMVILRDVTERRAHERRIEYLASHDSLTGLANRREFESVAEGLLQERRGRGHALLYLDLDQFKVVNDTCGHAAGDELLRQLTARLRRGIRDTDTLARLGGDEFGVLLVDCTLPQAEEIASKLVAGVNDWHFTWGEKQFTIGVSIGVVPLESDGAGLTALLSAADAACYAAKEAGRNRTVVYRPGDSALVARQDEMDWVARLTDALAEDRLELYCQRIVDSAALAGVRYDHWELLLRLRERDGTLVEPGRFLPAAERFNLAPSIDRRVIQRALGGIKLALASGASGQGVYAVNLSGATVCDPDFGGFVEDAFRVSGVPPAMVCFEMTETAAIASIDAARMFIARMHDIGARIALDDFGSGMSSFAYLRALSVDYLKIDGLFVRDLPGDPVSVAMVRAIYELSRAIGVRTVAEFIETDAAYDHVRKLGGDLAQGFALHRPEPWQWDPRQLD